jgi:hypothetical protein
MEIMSIAPTRGAHTAEGTTDTQEKRDGQDEDLSQVQASDDAYGEDAASISLPQSQV